MCALKRSRIGSESLKGLTERYRKNPVDPNTRMRRQEKGNRKPKGE